jgi:hypothetical protein
MSKFTVTPSRKVLITLPLPEGYILEEGETDTFEVASLAPVAGRDGVLRVRLVGGEGMPMFVSREEVPEAAVAALAG